MAHEETTIAARKKSAWIILLGVFYLLGSLPLSVLGLIGGISGFENNKTFSDWVIDIVMRLAFIGGPILFMAAGFGLIRQVKWGRTCALLASVLTFLGCGALGAYGIMARFEVNDYFIPSCFLVMMVFGLIIYVLTRPRVFCQFEP